MNIFNLVAKLQKTAKLFKYIKRGSRVCCYAGICPVDAGISLFCNNRLLRDQSNRLLIDLFRSSITWKEQEMMSVNGSPPDLFERMLDNALDAFVTIDTNSTVIGWSSRAEALFGWQTHEAVNRPLAALIIPERFQQAHLEGLRRYLATGENRFLNRRVEVSALHKDGREFPVELSITAIEFGNTRIFSASLRDITERKAMEEALQKKTEELERSRTELQRQANILQAILDSIAEGVTVADPDKHLVLHNRAAEDMLGLQPVAEEEGSWKRYQLYQPGSDVPVPDDARPMRRAIQGMAVNDLEVEARPEGHPEGLCLSANARPLQDAAGNLLGGVVVFRDVTGQKKVERALRESEERFRSTFEQAAVGLVHCDLQGRFLRVNQKACDILGYDQTELLGLSINAVTLPEDRALNKEYTQRLVSGEVKTFSIEQRYVRKDGAVIWGNRTVSLSTDTSGQPIHSIGVLEDITVRKEMQEALSVSESHYRSLLESASGYFIYRIALDASASHGVRILLVSPSIRDIMGISDPYDADAWLAHLHPDDQRRVEAANRRCFEQGEVFNEQFRWQHPVRKEWIWLHCISSPTFSSGGKVAHFNGIVLDITDLKRGEKATQRLGAVLNATPDLVGFADPYEHVEYLNPAGRAMLGILPDEPLEGAEIRMYQPVWAYEMIANKALPEALKSGCWRGETVVLDRNGQEIPVSLVILAHKGTDGQVEFISTIARDISAHKHLERSLRELTTHLQSVREGERTRIAQEIHDELGGVLTAIKMDVSMCLDRFRHMPDFPAEKIASVLQLVDDAVTSLRRIINDLRPSLLDTVGLWAALEWQTSEFGERTGIETVYRQRGAERDMPEGRATAVFRICQEMLTNIARHAEASRVQVSVDTRSSEAIIRIRDNGRGITREDLYNAKSYGLLGIHERARQFNISVRIRGSARKGTSVTLRFPV